MRTLYGALLALILILAPAAHATTIRVALATNEAKVVVTAANAITVAVGEERRIIDGPVALATSGRLLVDGHPSPLDEATLSAGAAPLRFNGRDYRGAIRIIRDGGRLAVVNHVDLEDYLAGVIGAEMSPDWPIESLKAQAVASRSYALVQMNRPKERAWDLYATVASQVYRGMERETPSTRRAVDETAGVVALYDGMVAETFYHSSAGGRTASFSEVWHGADRPYLVPTVASDESSPHNHWRADFGGNEIRRRLAKGGIAVGAVRSITPARFGKSGRIALLRVTHSRGETMIGADRFRSLMGSVKLRSTRFSIARGGGKFYFVGHGYGHGVGMSQFSARGMAMKGATYDQIVTHFYNGVTLAPFDPASHRLARTDRPAAP